MLNYCQNWSCAKHAYVKFKGELIAVILIIMMIIKFCSANQTQFIDIVRIASNYQKSKQFEIKIEATKIWLNTK